MGTYLVHSALQGKQHQQQDQHDEEDEGCRIGPHVDNPAANLATFSYPHREANFFQNRCSHPRAINEMEVVILCYEDFTIGKQRSEFNMF